MTIKIAEKTYRNAKDLNILNEVVWYYQFKALNDHGFFKSGQVSQQTTTLNISTSTLWRRINKLISVGLMKKHRNGYQLISYDKLWTLLQYDMSVTTGRNGRKRFGSFKIHKITVSKSTFNNIKEWIAYVDLRDNLNKQTHAAFNKIIKDKRYRHAAISRTVILSAKKAALKNQFRNNVQTIRLYDETIESSKYDEFNQKQKHQLVNPDITLSLYGIMNLFGLSNTSSAHNIVQRLKSIKLIDVKQRIVPISLSIDFESFKKIAHNHFQRDGVLYRRLPNLITPLS